MSSNLDSNFLFQFVVCVGFLANTIGVCLALFRGGKAQARNVTIVDQFASKEALEVVKGDLNGVQSKVDQMRSEGEERAVNLHNRINPIVENTAEIKGRMEAFTTSFNNFTELLVEQTRKHK
jgi:hypothetical protein